eukprot:9117898-Alexandrium_andersonii.AAC.1
MLRASTPLAAPASLARSAPVRILISLCSWSAGVTLLRYTRLPAGSAPYRAAWSRGAASKWLPPT